MFELQQKSISTAYWRSFLPEETIEMKLVYKYLVCE